MSNEASEPTVNFFVRGRNEIDGERRVIPVSEIRSLADPALREALESQAKMAADTENMGTLVVNARRNETLHNTFVVSHRLLGVEFTADGVEEREV